MERFRAKTQVRRHLRSSAEDFKSSKFIEVPVYPSQKFSTHQNLRIKSIQLYHKMKRFSKEIQFKRHLRNRTEAFKSSKCTTEPVNSKNFSTFQKLRMKSILKGL